MAEGNQTTLASTRHQEERHLPLRRLEFETSQLKVLQGPHEGTILPIETELLLIGRGDWCDLVLSEDRKSSSEHCEIRLTEKGILVKDLGSRNGVYLDQYQIVEAYMQPGMQLSVGGSVLTLESQDSRREIEIRYYDQSRQLVGYNPRMRKIFSLLERLSKRDIPVLLTGETGTGKSCIARALHDQSKQREGPFVLVNCGAISANLMESLFFGYEQGAFTGANQRHRGFFEQAHNGTLFLDEIGELPLELQPRLLDVLERGKLRRLGSEKEREVQFRLISSTNRSLRQEVEQGRFRQDLYYRLEVATLEVPPLRERKEDLPLLVEHLFNHSEDAQNVLLTDMALRKMQDYLWPGNVRELRNVLYRALAFLDRENQSGLLFIDEHDLELDPLGDTSSEDNLMAVPSHTSFEPNLANEELPLKLLLEETEKQAILHALQKTGWNVSRAAELLKISRVWLHKRIKKFGLQEKAS